eukprot:GHVQ01004670.1.p1 GENE.GHVQ01004670.1~~GHVQ01004670.1.p1  ORF type:complete len:197 (+),score=24.48 GHVQ01004670.1:173-763(+)
MGNSFSKIDLGLFAASAGCVVVALTSSNLQNFLWLLRPLLNTSWGLLFGGSLWACVVQGPVLMGSFPKQKWAPVQGKSFGLFFKVATVSSSLLFLATAGLAPHSSLLLRSSLFCWAVSSANSLYFVPRCIVLSEEKLQREKDYNIGLEKEDNPEDVKAAKADKNIQALKTKFGLCHGLSMACAYAGLGALLPYVFV